MGFIENKVTLPQQLGKMMFLIAIFLFPYILQNYILFPEFMWIARPAWLACYIIGLFYAYCWAKWDKKNDPTKPFINSLKEANEIAKEANEITMRKSGRIFYKD